MDRLHRLIGLILGPWLMLVGLSGALLAFGHELDLALNRDLVVGEASALAPDFDAMAAAVRTAHPDRTLLFVQRHGLDPREHYPFVLGRAGATPVPGVELEGQGDLEVFVDARDNRIVGERRYHTLLRRVRSFHRELFVPGAGERVLGGLGAIVATTLIAGIVLWWRAGRKNLRRALSFRRDAPRPRFWRDMHSVSGIYIVTVLLFQTATGMMVSDWFQVRGLLAALRGTAGPLVPVTASGPTAIGINQASAAALALYPDSDVVLINLPVGGSPFYAVRLYPHGLDKTRHMRQVLVRADDGRVAMRFDPDLIPLSDRILNLWMIWIHNGNFFHVPGRLVLVCAGLVLASLFPTGLYIWWRKRPSRIRIAGRPRGAERKLASPDGHRMMPPP